MAEEKTCGICEKNAATEICEVCNVALCDSCLRKIKLQSGNPAEQQLNIGITSGASLSTLRQGIITRKLCEKCMVNIDVEP